MIPYADFLSAKVQFGRNHGFDIAADATHPWLKPHAAALVQWAIRKGRAAIFASFGLHKTSMALETSRIIAGAGGFALIVAPLGVRQEFRRDAEKLGITLHFIRRTEEIGAPGIYVTNYESARDSKLDVSRFASVWLDEAAVLRGFGGTKTFREFMSLFEGTQYRFVATATPSPNEYIELLAYAAFLGVMDVGQAKTRFFKRDSSNADKLTLHAHKVKEFWLWVSSWAIFLLKPSDLGFDDTGYVMPPIEVRWHEVSSDHRRAGQDREGQGRMFRNAAIGVSDAAAEKRASMAARIEKMQRIIDASAGGTQEGLSPSILSGEPGEDVGGAEGAGQRASGGHPDISARLPRAKQAGAADCAAGPGEVGLSGEQGSLQGQGGAVEGCQPGTHAGVAGGVYGEEPGGDLRGERRMVSVQQGACFGAGQETEAQGLRADRSGISGATCEPGRRLRDLRCGDGGSGQEGSSAGGSLPQDGCGAGVVVPAVQHGPGDVHGRSGDVADCDPVSDQFIVWCDLNDEQRATEAAVAALGLTASSIHGGLSVDEAEAQMDAWRDRRTAALIAKPVMLGCGVNLQQCNHAIFLGVNHKFHAFIQAVHRVQRFGQTRPVVIDIIYSEAERDIKVNLQDKWRRHTELVENMRAIVLEHGLTDIAFTQVLSRSMGVTRQEANGAGWRLANNDSVLECEAAESCSVDLIVTSIPFATQYEYTPTFNDFGHTDDNDHFWQQMDYLTPHLLRMLRPGRVFACHVKDRIVPGGLSGLGFQTLHPFHCEAIAHYTRHGFAFLGMKTITTDVVRENNQTYRLGWSEQCKDGSRMGCGVPEYLLLLRKPPTDASKGYADLPVVKDKPLCTDNTGIVRAFDKRDNWKRPTTGTGYSRAAWQLDAHGYTRSSGDRLISTLDLAHMAHADLYKWWEARSLAGVYDYAEHKLICEALDEMGRLPATFMLWPPHSVHPDVWSDITRMRTLNADQVMAGREMHLCPLQLDIVDRVVTQFSMPGETVFDPFAGIGTVPVRALKLGRAGWGSELSATYYADAVRYCRAAEAELTTPTLFDILDAAA